MSKSLLKYSDFLKNKKLVFESVFATNNVDALNLDTGEDIEYVNNILDRLMGSDVIAEDNVDYNGNLAYYKDLIDKMVNGELDDDQAFLDELLDNYRFSEYLGALDSGMNSYDDIINYLNDVDYKYLPNDVEIRLIEIYQRGTQEQQDLVYNIMILNRIKQMFRELNRWYAQKLMNYSPGERDTFIKDKVSDFIWGVGAVQGSEGYFRKSIRHFDVSTGSNYNSYFSRLLHGFATKYVKSVDTDISLDAPVGNSDGDDKEVSLKDTIEGEVDTSEPSYEVDDRKKVLYKAIGDLNDRDREIITRRFIDGQSMAEIAADMNTSVQNISRIVISILKKLSKNPMVQELRR